MPSVSPKDLPSFENALRSPSRTSPTSAESRIKLVLLLNGDTVEGVPTKSEAMFGARFGGVMVDPQPGDDPAQAYEWTLTIGGRNVLAQEVGEFTVKRS